MKILAINGSHRRGKNTAVMLNIVLEEAAKEGAETELLELVDYNIKPCLSCNRCLKKDECSINDDDMVKIAKKMLAADGIVLGSPVYFSNVTGLMKNFMDRTRWMHMRVNVLHGKIGAALTHAGLRNGGQETTYDIMVRFMMSHGLCVVDCRSPEGGTFNLGAMGALYDSLDGDTTIWRKSVLEDTLAVRVCRELGRNIIRFVKEKNK
ncbi:MAG: flavodoxin family protein [Eubacteriales bacterium]